MFFTSGSGFRLRCTPWAVIFDCMSTSDPVAEYPDARYSCTICLIESTRLAAGKPTVNGFYGNEPPGWSLAIAVRDVDRLALVERNLGEWLGPNGIAPAGVARIEVTPGEQPWNQDEGDE